MKMKNCITVLVAMCLVSAAFVGMTAKAMPNHVVAGGILGPGGDISPGPANPANAADMVFYSTNQPAYTLIVGPDSFTQADGTDPALFASDVGNIWDWLDSDEMVTVFETIQGVGGWTGVNHTTSLFTTLLLGSPVQDIGDSTLEPFPVVTVTKGSDWVNLTWSPMVDTGNNLQSYPVLTAPTQAGPFVGIGTAPHAPGTRSYNDTALSVGPVCYQLSVNYKRDNTGGLYETTGRSETVCTIVTGTAPYVVSTSPVNDAANVPLADPIVITFSEPMDTATVAYPLTPPDVAFTPVWSGGDTILTLTHATDFTPCQAYQVDISGMDLVSNALVPTPTILRFTTFCSLPSILMTVPSDGAIGVLLNQDIVVTFSEAMNTATVSCTPNPLIALTPAWSVGDTMLTLSHVTPFTASTLYTVTCTGQDVDGNDLVAGPVPNPWSFTTVGIVVPPEITNAVPPNGAIGVLLNQDIVVTFSEAMNTATVLCGLNPAITHTTAWSVGDTMLTLSHVTPFTASTLYTVTCTGQDVDGNALVAGAVLNPWSFTTVGIGPNIEPTATIDPSDTLIGLCCSGGSDLTIPWIMDDTETPLDQLVVWLNYTAGATTDTIAGPLTGLTSPYSYVWTTPTLNESVTIWLEVIDGAGDSAQDSSASVMIDSTAPFVQSVIPSEGQTDVPTDSQFVVTFSEPMQKPTVAISFTPSVSNVQLVWDATNTTATVTHALFQVSTLYTLTVDATAKDDCTPGTEMGTANTTTFTTGASPKLPGPPTNLAVSSTTYDSVVLTWSAPTQYTDGSTMPASDITLYRVYRAESSTGAKVSIGTPTATTFTDDNVEEENTYYYWVTTVNTTNIESDYSNEASTTVPKQETQDPDQGLWLWIIIIIIVILVVLGLILLMRRKKPEEEVEPEIEEELPPEEEFPEEEEFVEEEAPPEEEVVEEAPTEEVVEEAPPEEIAEESAPAEEAPAEEEAATGGPVSCPKCGTSNPEGISVCTSCGSPL